MSGCLEKCWVAVCQFDGFAEFYLGNAFAASEMEAQQAIEALMDRHFPSRPNIVALLPGTVQVCLDPAEDGI